MNRIGRGLLLALVLAACADDDDTADTLDPLQAGESLPTDGPAGGSIGSGLGGDTSPSSVPFEPAGEGTVTIQVRLAASGLDETLTLDRSTVPADQLDPISLYAACTAIDGDLGGGGYEVRVIDLRRLTSDSELVSAALLVEEPVERPGQYDVTLELSDVSQASTTYSGTLTLDRGLSAGTFEAVDERGDAATGSFSCVRPPPPTTTAPPPTTNASPPTTAPVTTTASTSNESSSASTTDASTTSVAIITTTVADTLSPPGT